MSIEPSAFAGQGSCSGSFEVRLAHSAADLRAAQRLRYRVFVEEMGGDGPLVDHAQKLECDALDPVFDHLLLVDKSRDPAAEAHVIGAYRLLPDTRLAAAGRFYCDAEFDLAPLHRSGRRLLELGRSCIDPAHRGGVGMLQMWQGLAEYVVQHDIGILFGAASFPGTDPAVFAQSLACLHHLHLAPEHLRVRATQTNGYRPLPQAELDRKHAMREMPPLIRAYLRLGGMVGEGVFIDKDFRTTDVCIILDTAHLTAQARSLAARNLTVTPQS
ncbi:MAG: GNAT family N-acetyltransferase [Natronohydrobacter sp.]|nr:GNAT family N-acetyltransferase [Natronohydrobacter sp.]